MSRIRLGYSIVNPYLKNININRGIKFNSIKKNGFDRMKDLAKQNISDLYKLLDWNINKNIKVFCLPNNIIPHIDNLNHARNFIDNICISENVLKNIINYEFNKAK